MRNERGARTFLLRRVPASAWLTIALLAAIGLLAAWWLVDGEGVSTVATGQGVSDFSSTDIVSDDAPPEVQLTRQWQAVGVPTPEAVIADPQCRMVVGQRTASDTALVYLPLGDGAWFAVVNTFGVVFDGTLPFIPERPAIGKRPDGTILAGFGLEGEVQVVHDGSVIYEFDDVWSFDIAHDGSSFFVVEPLAGDASRLVVHNLELREEHHFDLGTTAVQDRGSNTDLSYSMDLAEVIVQPSHGNGGVRRFFPVVGGDPREVAVEQRQSMLPKDMSFFATSELSYHAHNVGDAAFDQHNLQWTIVKVERDFGTGVERSHRVWTRDLRFLPILSMQLSPDGHWLLLSDVSTGIEVLDTTDGETVFSYPPYRDMRLTMPRFFRPEPNELYAGRFVGEELFVMRGLEDEENREAWDVEVYKLDRFAKTARKVREFRIEPGADETEESFVIRTSLDAGAALSCADYARLDRRLVISDGRLTYRASDY